jgi:uncharacterized protein
VTALTQQLLELQALDAEIGRLQRQVDQLTAAIGDQLKVKAGDLAIRQAEEALKKAQSAQRDREYELSTLEARIKDHEAKLYSGKGSPRDLQALQRDIEHDRERRNGLEEQALASIDGTDKARKEVERIRGAVARVLSESSAGKEKQARERDEALTSLTKRRAQREEALGAIPATTLQLYDRLRQRTPDGIAVAEVTQSRCEGCRTTLPSAEVQRARTSSGPVQCSACQRILHVR